MPSDRHVSIVELVVVGMRNAENRELSSAPPRYDAKPARFALNQGSRKLCSGGVTCPGLIRCPCLEKRHCILGRKRKNH